MNSFESVKRDFGRGDNYEGVSELRELKLDIPDSEFYDEEEHLVMLT